MVPRDRAGSKSRAARSALAIALGLAAALSIGPVCAAGDGPLRRLPRPAAGPAAPPAREVRDVAYRPAPLSLAGPRPRSVFYRDHLLPRLNYQFDRMAAYQAVPDAGTALGDYVLFDVLTDSARRRAERGTRKALRNYLLETTPVGRFVHSIRGESGEPERSSRLGFALKVVHGTPRADLRYRMSSSVIRLGLGVDGSVAVELKNARRLQRTRLSAGYDPGSGEYDLGCRISF